MPDPALADEVRKNQWYLQYLAIGQAHEITEGSGIVVAVIDTGVDPHPDLRGNILDGKNFIYGTNNNDGKLDSDGHGTAMAGLIAGHGSKPGSGILGIAPKSKILPVRGLNSNKDISYTSFQDALNWTIERRPEVMNLSVAGSPTIAMHNAINRALAADILVVAGSGNDGAGAAVAYPAAYDGVLAVGAIDQTGKHTDFSVKSRKIALCAPGVSLETTSLDGRTTRLQGTSGSTAIVSGAAALVRSKFPTLSAPEVIHRLTATATDIGPKGRDDECGYGVLNIVKALTADVPPLTPSSATTPPPSRQPQATPQEKDDDNTPLILGGIVAFALLVGGLVTGLVLWQRRGA